MMRNMICLLTATLVALSPLAAEQVELDNCKVELPNFDNHEVQVNREDFGLIMFSESEGMGMVLVSRPIGEIDATEALSQMEEVPADVELLDLPLEDEDRASFEQLATLIGEANTAQLQEAGTVREALMMSANQRHQYAFWVGCVDFTTASFVKTTFEGKVALKVYFEFDYQGEHGIVDLMVVLDETHATAALLVTKKEAHEDFHPLFTEMLSSIDFSDNAE